ncbi:adenylate/guanylate cyclase domain-containing protein [Oscillatoria sp. CS-180]|uniref:adenylate/guanylate cyclase domain-containing protein n=1 Tax=Oscillatoria sp. CS-180 TaxID=3021720 RepID=UPI0023308466|nr:adenylate/guanylate cyclase domain-containing protein [Oscillatoria sp. CS-180]MDB9526627.1 adenylate/guanylate cyclase domain-containing protein [Oscillatoria sp. CS-180]
MIFTVQDSVIQQSGPYVVLNTESGNRQLSLVGSNCWTVGRSDDNNLVLPDRWISRNHAMIQVMETGEFYLIDLGSRNGSFVNGRRVSVPVILRDSDQLTFGQTELQFYCPTKSRASGSEHQKPRTELTATATLHLRRLISVMVVDIRDFTVMTRQIDEKVLSESIGTWFRCAGEIIDRYGSWVDKYIGDAVMAVWIHGADEVAPGEMLNIMQAIDALAKMTAQLHKQFPLPFPLRIGAGLNTGYAMVGNTGTGDRPDYTAIGDTVNSAFRFESSTKQLGLDVAVGETTYEYLTKMQETDSLFHRYTVNMKGYETPIVTHATTFSDLERFVHLQEQ